jgi:phage terminase large subunit-like protein
MKKRRHAASLSAFELVGLLPDAERDALLKRIGDDGTAWLKGAWDMRARPDQQPPGGDWSIWLVMAGRGFGKTRLGAEWVRQIAQDDGSARIALIGASPREVREVMIEGESGLLSVTPRDCRPKWHPARRRLIWPNGAQAFIYGASAPESLRGPQHSHAWADEIGKWPHALAAWDNMLMSVRLGRHPRVLATTTPAPTALLRRLTGDPKVEQTRGRMQDNRASLSPAFLDAMEATYGGTRLGRQELDGELLFDQDGALWTRAMLEHCVSRPDRQRHGRGRGRDAFCRVVVGVDPPAGEKGDACGVIAAGLDEAGIAHVLEDASIARPSPEQWARRVAETAERWTADRIVAEANNGGSMVRSVLHAVNAMLPIKLVHASAGKTARAEPVAALYEAGRVLHIQVFPQLDDQLCGMLQGGRYAGPGRSPDRADALVWALTELMLQQKNHVRFRSI